MNHYRITDNRSFSAHIAANDDLQALDIFYDAYKDEYEDQSRYMIDSHLYSEAYNEYGETVQFECIDMGEIRLGILFADRIQNKKFVS